MDWFETAIRRRMQFQLQEHSHTKPRTKWWQCGILDMVDGRYHEPYMPALEDPLSPRWSTIPSDQAGAILEPYLTTNLAHRDVERHLWIMRQLWARNTFIEAPRVWREAQEATADSFSRLNTLCARQLFVGMATLPSELRLVIYENLVPSRSSYFIGSLDKTYKGKTIPCGRIHEKTWTRREEEKLTGRFRMGMFRMMDSNLSLLSSDSVVHKEIGWSLSEQDMLGDLYDEFLHDWYKRQFFSVGDVEALDHFLTGKNDYAQVLDPSTKQRSFAPLWAIQHLRLNIKSAANRCNGRLDTQIRCLAHLQLHDAATLQIRIDHDDGGFSRMYGTVIAAETDDPLGWLHEHCALHDQQLHCLLTIMSTLDCTFDAAELTVVGQISSWCGTLGECRAYFQGRIDNW